MATMATLAAIAPLASAQPAQNNLAAMAAIASGLGVKCDFCHVPGQGRGLRPPPPPPAVADGPPTPAIQPAVSVAPTHMDIARQMMVMTRDLNSKVQMITSKSPTDATRVTCVTCHRGVSIPGQLSDIMAATDNSKGPEAAIQQYRDLRKQYYGRQSYDFGEDTLVTAGINLANTHPEDAVALLKLNLEFFPQSVQSYVQMAYAYTRKLDDQSAIGALEKALELQPENGAVKGRLEQLKGYRKNQKP